jgi:hypothetical protein
LKLPLDALLLWGETIGATGNAPYDEMVIEKHAVRASNAVRDHPCDAIALRRPERQDHTSILTGYQARW